MDLRRRITIAAILLLMVIAVSIFGYRLLGGPNVTFLQALYMAIITLAGIGYGEVVDTSNNPELRVFNIVVIVIGWVIAAFVLASITAFLVEGDYTNQFRRRKMLKKIAQMKDHFIICGAGDTGRHAVAELHKTLTPFVVVEAHEDNIKRLLEHGGEAYQEMLYVIGDATDEEVLEQAGVSRAAGLMAALPHDKDNLVVTVLVQQKNPNLRIVARCTDQKFSERMQKAGADSVVSPNRIGGLRLASEMLRPHVVGFLDLMIKESGRTLRIEDLIIPEGSSWSGRSLGDLSLRLKYNLLPMAIKNAQVEGQGLWVNPPDNITVKPGLVVIVIGDVHDIRRAREDAKKTGVFA